MKLLDKGVKNVVITMGAAGAYLCMPEMSKMIR
jgi:fructose-1-phosphate kinase PfkB-like protein